MAGLWTELPIDRTSFRTLLDDYGHACAYAAERKEKWGDGDSEYLAATKKADEAKAALVEMVDELSKFKAEVGRECQSLSDAIYQEQESMMKEDG